MQWLHAEWIEEGPWTGWFAGIQQQIFNVRLILGRDPKSYTYYWCMKDKLNGIAAFLAWDIHHSREPHNWVRCRNTRGTWRRFDGNPLMEHVDDEAPKYLHRITERQIPIIPLKRGPGMDPGNFTMLPPPR